MPADPCSGLPLHPSTMRRPLLPVLLGAATLVLAPTLARAHAIQSDLTVVGASHSHPHPKTQSAGTRLELASHFSTGLPAGDASVRLIPAQGGTAIELGRTDANGRLAFALPAGIGRDAEIQVDAGAGHRDWIELSELGRPARQASRPSANLPGNLLSLAPLAALGLLGGLLGGLARLNRPRG
jgi:nickel transport protein